MVAGSASPTADVLRAAIQVIGTKPGLKTVSSCFIMVLDEKAKNYGDDGILIFSDCGVVPHPNSEQMADIATSAAYSARQIGLDPRVALLSFSTMGSASHECVDRVQEAVKILKNRSVDFKFDGELQADAALVPSVITSYSIHYTKLYEDQLTLNLTANYKQMLRWFLVLVRKKPLVLKWLGKPTYLYSLTCQLEISVINWCKDLETQRRMVLYYRGLLNLLMTFQEDVA